MKVKIRYQLVCAILTAAFLLQAGFAAALPLETIVSQRWSVRSFTAQTVTSQQLLDILWASYGYAGVNRVVPSIGDVHALELFAVNSSGSYKYSPESNSLSVWDNTVTKTTISPDLLQSWQVTGNVILVVVWNQTKMGNQYFAAAEVGCLAQNVYLQAANLNLGTTSACTIDSNGLRNHLKLPSTMIPLLILPLGVPTYNYDSSATPDINRMNGNLPLVQVSSASFTDALYNLKMAQEWSTQSLSLQHVSQLLWAAYGYSSTGHRTTPSAGPTYPLIVYISNSTGTYRYLPETHSTSLIQSGDKRNAIATACGNQLWVANAPSVFLLALNTSRVGNQGITDYEWAEADAGCVIQQILLEASANSLSVNVVSNGLESWNGVGAQTIKNILALEASIVPLYIVPVGHPYAAPEPVNSIAVVRGLDNGIYYGEIGSSSNSWTQLPSGLTADSPAAVLAGTELHIVVRSIDGSNIWHSYVNTSSSAFSGWIQLSGFTPSAPTLASNSTHLCLVVRGLDDRIFCRLYNLSSRVWTEWTALPSGYTIDSPAAAILNNKLHVAVRSTDGSSIWHSNVDLSTGVFSGWSLVGGFTQSAPTMAVCNDRSEIVLIVRGLDNAIYRNSWSDSGWAGWVSLPSGTTGEGAGATVTGQDLQILVLGIEGNIIWKSSVNLSSGAFSGWTLLNGLTPSKPTLTG